MQAHFIDVGQADAALLEFPCGAVLVDAGLERKEDDFLITYLDEFFARRPDLKGRLSAVYITHNHHDHTKGLAAVAKKYQPGVLVHTGRESDSGARPVNDYHKAAKRSRTMTSRPVSDSEVVEVEGRTGLTDSSIDPISTCEVEIGGEKKRVDVQIRILSAALKENPGWDAGVYDNANNHSLVIRVDYGLEGESNGGKVASFLFTGDLERDAMDTLVDYYQGTTMLDVDVYQVSHHGSENGTTDAFMDASTPLISVLSNGACYFRAPKDRFTAYQHRHPRRRVVDMLEEGTLRRYPRRATREVLVGEPYPDYHSKGRFTTRVLTKQVYSTGWDQTVVIQAEPSGRVYVKETVPKPGPGSKDAEICIKP